jgi:glycosyltransferase involved in cell wall biosynthesis
MNQTKTKIVKVKPEKNILKFFREYDNFLIDDQEININQNKTGINILITCPSFKVPHGGIRVILEWANRLNKWHNIVIFVKDNVKKCDWFNIDEDITINGSLKNLHRCNCVIITSPHTIFVQDNLHKKQKCFIFMQMMEHMFIPNNMNWYNDCVKFYTSKHPLFSISKWNIEMLKNEFKRSGVIHYIGNGVNFKDFTINREPKNNNNHILVEGWESTNPTKDFNHIAAKVAKKLKKDGYNIIVYSNVDLYTLKDVPDEFYKNPSISKLNELYNKAAILIKASQYDARSCSPMEAMTKGTPTVRAITKGDDDLIDGYNAIIVPYDETSLYNAATNLLNNKILMDNLSINCLNYVEAFNWDFWVDEINQIIIK